MIEESLVCPEKLPGAEAPVLVLVDGSNVAFGGNGAPRLRNLVAVLQELAIRGIRAVTLVDASLRHRIDDRAGLEEMTKSGQVLQVPAGRQADEFLLQLGVRAHEKGEDVYILTNDRFPDKEGNGTVRRIALLAVPLGDSEELLFSPALESIRATGR